MCVGGLECIYICISVYVCGNSFAFLICENVCIRANIAVSVGRRDDTVGRLV